MRLLVLKAFAVSLATVLAAELVLAASPEEKTRFLDAVRVAYSARNKDAVMALQCWDGVSKDDRDFFKSTLDITLPTNKVSSVEYRTDYSLVIVPSRHGGVVYVPNLTPIMHIQVNYETEPPMRQFLGLNVGETNGKLMLVQWVPQK